MDLFKNHDPLPDTYQGAVITLGNFDGIHKGHQKIFHQVINKAKELGKRSMVITFFPHPVRFLYPEKHLEFITTYDDKLKLIKDCGIDGLLCFEFTSEFARNSPQAFIKKYIFDLIHPLSIYVGNNFTFGEKRGGNVDLLKELGKEYNFEVHIVNIHIEDGMPVSSTLIRELLYKGQVSNAGKYLGRPFSLSGTVTERNHDGKSLGFPTCNIIPEGVLLPAKGVYAARVQIPQGIFNSAVYVGNRPTFDRGQTIVEAHLFDFNENLYGKTIRVHFFKRIRGEIKFNKIETLINRIKLDVEQIKLYFEQLTVKG